jgi:hypothetical protein
MYKMKNPKNPFSAQIQQSLNTGAFFQSLSKTGKKRVFGVFDFIEMVLQNLNKYLYS